MKSKAASAYAEARILALSGRWDGAASRAYYALYHALTAELEDRGRRASDFARVDPRYPEKWPHWLVVLNCRAAGLTQTEAELVDWAQQLRVDADYGGDPVQSQHVQEVLSRVPELLEGLGVERDS